MYYVFTANDLETSILTKLRITHQHEDMWAHTGLPHISSGLWLSLGMQVSTYKSEIFPLDNPQLRLYWTPLGLLNRNYVCRLKRDVNLMFQKSIWKFKTFWESVKSQTPTPGVIFMKFIRHSLLLLGGKHYVYIINAIPQGKSPGTLTASVLSGIQP